MTTHTHQDCRTKDHGRKLGLATALIGGLLTIVPTAPALAGACCVTNLCLDASPGECASMSGLYLGDSSACSNTECIGMPHAGGPGISTHQIPQFNDQGGARQLQAVSILVRGTLMAEAQVTNLSDTLFLDSPGTYFNGTLTLGLPLTGDHQFAVDSALGCFDVLEPGQTCDMSPALMPQIPANVLDQANANEQDLSQFNGNGTFPISVTASGNFQWAATTPSAFQPDLHTFGEIVVAYEFSLAPACPADVNSDGMVDVHDLLATIMNWGCVGSYSDQCDGDVNQSLMVDTEDLVEIVLNWGTCDE